MPEQSFDGALRAARKGDVPPVWYLVGREDLLKDELIRTVIAQVLDPSMRDFNLDQRTATSLDPESLTTLLDTLPMMAERRVVILRDVEGWQKRSRGRAALLHYLQRPSPGTVLILVQGAADPDADAEIAQASVVVPCAPLEPARALRWLEHRAARDGLAIPADAAEHLLRVTGGELAPLEAEMAKLASLPEGTEITRDLIGSLVGIRHGETMYDWRDAVFDGDVTRALALLGPVLDQSGVSGVKLVTLVGTTLVGLALARAHHERRLSGGQLERAIFDSLRKARPFGLPDWKAESARWARWAPAWSPARLAAATRTALETDIALKNTTLSNEQALVTGLVLRLTLGEGGQGGKGGRSRMRQGLAVALLVSVVSLFSAVSALTAQSTPLSAALALAQEGRVDSARTTLQRLETSTAPSDSLYPGILYGTALVAPDAAEARRRLQRVVIEYPLSPWAGEATIRLGQLDFASGDAPAAAKHLEKFRSDHAASPLYPVAAVWGARVGFEQKDIGGACQWVAEGLARNPDGAARTELIALSRRCSTPDSAPRSANTVVPVQSQVTDSVRIAPPVAGPPPSATPPPAAGPISAPAAFRIQVAATNSAAAAEQVLRRAESAGFPGVIVEEGGYHKVRLGSYASRGDAAAALARVKSRLGGAPFVVAP